MPCNLNVIYAKCHLYLKSFILNVNSAQCHKEHSLLIVIVLNVVTLSVVVLNVVMLNAVMPNVVMLNVVAPHAEPVTLASNSVEKNGPNFVNFVSTSDVDNKKTLNKLVRHPATFFLHSLLLNFSPFTGIS
jgi:hypothetical protein